MLMLTSKKAPKKQHLLPIAFGSILLLCSLPVATTYALDNLSHSYHDTTSMNSGDLVSLSPNKSDYINLASLNNAANLLGIVVKADDSLLAVNSSPGTVQVATSGTANALVSTFNGNISVGDQISVSPFNGIGMKANPGLSVIGEAQSSLDNHTSGIAKEEVLNKQGQETSILVGYVKVTISPSSDSSGADGQKLNSLQEFILSLTGHVVSTARIIVSLVITVLTILGLLAIIYAAIYSGVVSVGRNPLAKNDIYATLRTVLLMALVVGAASSVTVYLLLL